VLGAAAVVALAPAELWSRLAQGQTGGAAAVQRHLLTVACELVVPATDTPGAAEAGVPAFVELALAHGLNGTGPSMASAAIQGPARTPAPPSGLGLLDWLQQELDRRAGGFLAATPLRQQAALSALDSAAYAPDAPPHWRNLKGLILIGYYTSQIGGSQELQYAAVPGRFDPDLPSPANNRAWSSDWTALAFG
jgi:hypothetical protein